MDSDADMDDNDLGIVTSVQDVGGDSQPHAAVQPSFAPPQQVETAQALEKVYPSPLYSVWDERTLTFVGSKLYFPDPQHWHRVVMPPSTTPAGEAPAEAFRAAMPSEVASAFRFRARLMNEGEPLEGYGVPISTGVVFLLNEQILFHHPYTAISEVRTMGPKNLRYSFIPPAPYDPVYVTFLVDDADGIAQDLTARAQAFSSLPPTLSTGPPKEGIGFVDPMGGKGAPDAIEYQPAVYGGGAPQVTTVHVVEAPPQRVVMDGGASTGYRPQITRFGRSIVVMSLLLILGAVVDLVSFPLRDLPVIAALAPQFSWIGWVLGALELLIGGFGLLILKGKLALPVSVAWASLVVALTILALAAWGSFYAFVVTLGFTVTVVGGIQLAVNALCHLACAVQGFVFTYYARKDDPRQWEDAYRPCGAMRC